MRYIALSEPTRNDNQPLLQAKGSEKKKMWRAVSDWSTNLSVIQTRLAGPCGGRLESLSSSQQTLLPPSPPKMQAPLLWSPGGCLLPAGRDYTHDVSIRSTAACCTTRTSMWTVASQNKTQETLRGGGEVPKFVGPDPIG